jgi:hypothetical protein
MPPGVPELDAPPVQEETPPGYQIPPEEAEVPPEEETPSVPDFPIPSLLPPTGDGTLAEEVI